MAVLLGCIADDFTGGTDLAGMLVKHGMRTVQMIGVPAGPVPEEVDAIVIGLKTRSNPPEMAVRESLGGLRWLQDAGARQFYFKYCSTFDSTAQGNIGPVTEALMDALGTDFTIACPAFPANFRTVYQGHLFVGDLLLSDSGMRNHPLTPMTDANLVRVLQAQVRSKVGLVHYAVVSQDAAAITQRFSDLRREGYRIAIVDALANADLQRIGAACADLPLITAGSGLALGLPENFRRSGLLSKNLNADALSRTSGYRAVIAGSCSNATQAQVAMMRAERPSFFVDALELARGEKTVAQAMNWASDHLGSGPILIYATSNADHVKRVQAELGVERAGEIVETALAAIANDLVSLGVGQLIVAGGETSGAVVKALGAKGLRIGTEIDPGVPWTTTLPESAGQRPLALALISGNFGSRDFFAKAWRYLP